MLNLAFDIQEDVRALLGRVSNVEENGSLMVAWSLV